MTYWIQQKAYEVVRDSRRSWKVHNQRPEHAPKNDQTEPCHQGQAWSLRRSIKTPKHLTKYRTNSTGGFDGCRGSAEYRYLWS